MGEWLWQEWNAKGLSGAGLSDWACPCQGYQVSFLLLFLTTALSLQLSPNFHKPVFPAHVLAVIWVAVCHSSERVAGT